MSSVLWFLIGFVCCFLSLALLAQIGPRKRQQSPAAEPGQNSKQHIRENVHWVKRTEGK